MTIRASLFIIIAFFSMIVSFFSVSTIRNLVEEKSNFEQARHATHTIKLLLIAGGQWAVERGITNTALQDKNIVSKEFANKFRERRFRGNEAYKMAMKRIKTYHLPTSKEYIKKLEQAYAKAQLYRSLAEKEYKKPKLERNKYLLKNWVSVMSEPIIASQNLRFVLTRETSLLNSELGRQAYLKHFSWIMSEYAGRERAIIGGILSSNQPITVDKLDILYHYRGRVLAGWDLLQKIADSSHQDVRSAIQFHKEIFWDGFEKYRAKIYKDGISEKSYHTTSKEWIVRSTQAIDTILDIQQASVRETQDYIHNYSDKIMQKIYMNGLLLFLCFLVLPFSIYIILQRISYPLFITHKTLNKLLSSSQDLQTLQVSFTDREDEIGNLSKGLDKFRLTLIKEKEFYLKEKQMLENEKKIEQEKRQMQEEAQLLKELQMKKEIERAENLNKLIKSFLSDISNFMEEVEQTINTLYSSSSSLTKISHQTDLSAKLLLSQTQSMKKIIQEIQASTSNLDGSLDYVENSMYHAEETIRAILEFTNIADVMTKKFNHSSKKILTVVDAINTISKQTNLISFNASIESTRAGERGEGFNVVASEIKSLSVETENSVKEINLLINDMYESSMRMGNILQGINSSMEKVRTATSQIEGAVQEQKDNSQRITSTVDHSSDVSSTVLDTSSGLSKDANQGYAVSREIRIVTKKLVKQSLSLQSFVMDFIEKIKAA